MERCDSCEDLEQETTNPYPSMRDQPLCIRTSSSKIKREKLDIEKEEFETTVSVIKTDLDPGDNDVEMKSYDDNKHNTSELCSCVAASSRSLEQSSPPVLHENPFRDSVAAQMENGSIASREKYVVEINCLPQVAFLKILSYLSMKERLNASSVSKHWYNSCFDSSLWRKICLKGQKSVTDKVFCHLTHFSNSLIVLDISECGTISSDGLVKGLSQCLQLLELRIVRCYNCTDACLEEVGLTCKRLKLLDISLCSKVTDEGIQKMSVGCTKLEQLTMDQCRSLTSKSLFYVARNCPNLSVLSIEYNSHIEDDGVIALVQNCQFLKKIHLNSSGVTFRSVMCFASFCRNIVVLDVRNCKGLTDEVMFDLVSCCKSLEIMNLSLCFDVSDESISHIAKYCTKLRSLFLVHCKITDKGLKTFCKCNCDLERLDVSWCQEITGEGVRAIVEGCCTLTHLGLVRCDKVEEELVAELSQQYPHVFLSTFMTEMNRMFNKAGYSNGVQAILHPTSVES